MLRVVFEQSHTKSFESAIQGAFKLQLIPMGAAVKATSLHYIIALDTSGSMTGEKIRKAKEAAISLVEEIPAGNYLSLITFSSDVDIPINHILLESEEHKQQVISIIQQINAGGSTAFYKALNLVIELSQEYQDRGYAILLTDGLPTDVSNIDAYRKIMWPRNLRSLIIGVGVDYNRELLALLADKSGGVLIHIDEHDIGELIEAFRLAAVKRIYASDVVIRIKESTGKARFIGYDEKEINIPVLSDENIEVMGEVEIPANFNGVVATLEIEYYDPREDTRVKRVLEYKVEPARSREEFISGINRNVFDEYLYYTYIEEAKKLSLQGDLASATQKLKSAEQVASRTMRLDLVSQTRQLMRTVERTKAISGDESASRKLLSMTMRVLRKK